MRIIPLFHITIMYLPHIMTMFPLHMCSCVICSGLLVSSVAAAWPWGDLHPGQTKMRIWVFAFHLRSFVIWTHSSLSWSTVSISFPSFSNLGVISLFLALLNNINLDFSLLIFISFSSEYVIRSVSCVYNLDSSWGRICSVLLWYVSGLVKSFLISWDFLKSIASASVRSSTYFQCLVLISFFLFTAFVILIPISLLASSSPAS